MSNVSTMKMTARQFMQLGEDPPGVRLELVDGEIAVSPSPNPRHSYTEKALSYILQGHIRPDRIGRLYGDVDTIFGRHDVRRPDLIYFRRDRLHLVGKQAMKGPPDLCVEIVSLGSRRIDRQDKFVQYESGGVANYWIVDPRRRIVEGYQLRAGRYELSGQGKDSDVLSLPPFEALQIHLEELWEPEDQD